MQKEKKKKQNEANLNLLWKKRGHVYISFSESKYFCKRQKQNNSFVRPYLPMETNRR